MRPPAHHTGDAGRPPTSRELVDESADRAPANETAESFLERAAVVSQMSHADRTRLFDEMALTPAGIRALVRLRSAVRSGRQAIARAIDEELRAVLSSLFAPEHLRFEPIGPSSSLALHQHIVHAEAVHPFSGWADLRRRLDPHDRRCFGMFHSAMPDQPVAFVEAALVEGSGPLSIAEVLDPSAAPLHTRKATTAVFYAISSPEAGLRGIPFGRALLERTIAALSTEMPWVSAFRTLSPIPGFRSWLSDATGAPEHDADELARLHGSLENGEAPGAHATALRRAIETYLLTACPGERRWRDPVARFHLGNDARLRSVHLDADTSSRGFADSYGAMASYEYERPSA